MADPEVRPKPPTPRGGIEGDVAATKSQVDEQRIARGVAIGLPLVTLVVAAVVGMLTGTATSLLVIAAGLLLGVIALLWGSIRILSGDAELPPELEALDMAAQGVDALASRKKMLLRALKDLENEHGIGKIEDDDYELVASTYREDLKVVLKKIDESLAPHRLKAEELARAHMVRAGITDAGYRGQQPATAKAEAPKEKTTPARLECPKCQASNEPDAKFCKECASILGDASTKTAAADPPKESADA